jgi:hypothetical protein
MGGSYKLAIFADFSAHMLMGGVGATGCGMYWPPGAIFAFFWCVGDEQFDDDDSA